MAAITNATTTTTVADSVLSEIIARLVQMEVETPYHYQGVALIPPLLVGSKTYNHPVFAQFSNAGAHTESDEVSSQAITPTAASISTSSYATASFVSDEADTASIIQVLPVAVSNCVSACQRTVDQATMNLATSMTNSVGSAATVNGLENMNSVLASFRAQAKGSQLPPVVMLSVAARRDLGADAATSGAALYGSVVGPQLWDASVGAGQAMFMPFMGGTFAAESDRMPVGDTTGKTSFICHVGPNESALAVPFKKSFFVEMQRRAERVGQWVVCSVEFGAGILDQDRALAFITQA